MSIHLGLCLTAILALAAAPAPPAAEISKEPAKTLPAVTATGGTAISDGFKEDANLQKAAEAYAQDAVDYARESFGIKLDGADESIRNIENMLARLHDDLAKSKPKEAQVVEFSKMFGSYVGEVFRKNHGAKWGIVTLQGKSLPGMEATKSATRFWPWSRVVSRIMNGPEDNVWDYYQALVAKESAKPSASVTGTVELKDATKYGPETVVEISLLDVSKADAPAVTMGKQVLKDFKAFPIAFEVPHDPAAVKPGHRYTVSVRIQVSGRLAFISDTAVPVINDGPTKEVKVPVAKVKQPQP